MAAVPPDLVQDVVFGTSLVVSGIEIVRNAIGKVIASAVTFFVMAASVYGLFYL